MTLTGSNDTLTNNGRIDPMLLGTGLGVLSSGAVMGNAGASTQTVTNNGVMAGTTGLSIGLTGMALAVQNGAGGTTNITNTGTMSTSGIIGATMLGPDAGVIAAYGGGQINLNNSGTITGRVGLGSSAGGNTFTNSGTVNGSISLGMNSTNQFIAVTGSAVNAAGGTGLSTNLGIGATTINFAATGTVDGGAGGNNTLTLQQGFAVTGTIDNGSYVNFSHLDVESGTWNLNGASSAWDAIVGNGATAIINNSQSLGTGTVVVNGGSIQSDVSGLTLSNNITATGSGLAISGGTGLELSGSISGAGTLTKSGTGTLTLTGANLYTGGTNLNGGTLVVGNNQALGVGTLTIGGNASLDAAQAVTLSNSIGINSDASLVLAGSNVMGISGGISGGGGIIKNGAATATLTGTNTFTGGTIVNAGTLALGAGGSLATGGRVSLSGAGASFDISASGANQTIGALSGAAGTTVSLGANSLTVGDASDQIFGGSVSGTGGITKHGAGKLSLTGSNIYTGLTSVRGGILELAGGSLFGQVNVGTSGTFSGSGSIGALTVGSGGTLLLGDALTPDGTLNVSGDVTFSTGSTFALDIGADGRSDRIASAGAAILNGGSLSVNALDPTTSYQQGQTYTFLSATDGVSGRFASVSATSAFLEFYTTYNPNDVQLTIGVAASSFEGAARTANQRAVARSLDTLEQSGDSLALYNRMLVLSADDASTAFEELGGVVYASGQSGFVRSANAVNNVINNRIRSTTNGVVVTPVTALGYTEVEPSNLKNNPFSSYDTKSKSDAFDQDRFAIWGTGLGSWGTIDGTDGGRDTDTRTSGLLIGADGMISDQWRAGIFAGYSYSSFDAGAEEQRSKNYHAGLYADGHWGGASLRTGVNYTRHDVDTTRVIGSLGEALVGSYNGDTVSAFGELAYRVDVGSSAFEPFAAISHTYNRTSAFTESGGLAALTVEGNTMNTTGSTIGVRAATTFDLGQTLVVARGTLGWMHSFGDVNPISTARFATGEAFSVSGTPIDRNALLIEAGMDFALSRHSTLGIGYNGQISTRASDHAFNAGLKVRF
jgi:outer membrane autotransporter protein